METEVQGQVSKEAQSLTQPAPKPRSAQLSTPLHQTVYKLRTVPFEDSRIVAEKWGHPGK